jgi:hypothetical protein
MIPQASTSEFNQNNIDKVFSALISSDEELRNHFDNYINEEYEE